jgi:hypothetical protein
MRRGREQAIRTLDLLAWIFGLSLASAGALTAQTPITPPLSCQLTDANVRWIQQALNGWEAVSRDALRFPPSSLPWIVLYDDACAWHLAFDEALIPEGVPVRVPLCFQGTTRSRAPRAVMQEACGYPMGQRYRRHRTSLAHLYTGTRPTHSS